MKKFSRLLALMLVVIMAFTLTSCGGGKTAADIQESGKIVMATNAEFEPFEYVDGNEIVGIDIEIANKVAEKLGVELEIQNMEFDSVVASVKSGKTDFGAAGISITEKRQKSVAFSNTYFNASQMIIVPVGSEITTADDLAGKTIGVQLGTTGDTYCTEELKDVTVTRYDKGADAVQALIAGKVDAVVIDNFPATKYVEKNSDKIVMLEEALTDEPYAICVNKGSQEILDAINQVLAEMESSGELQAIIDNYMGEIE